MSNMSNVSNASNVHVLHQTPPRPQLHSVRAGELFGVAPHDDRIFARLTHAQLDVSDATDIWCVVIIANPGCPMLAGAMCKFPRDVTVKPYKLMETISLWTP